MENLNQIKAQYKSLSKEELERKLSIAKNIGADLIIPLLEAELKSRITPIPHYNLGADGMVMQQEYLDHLAEQENHIEDNEDLPF